MKRRIFYMLFAVLIVLNIAVWGIFLQSQSHPAQAQAETVALAQAKVGLTQPIKFYLYHKDDTVYTVEGTDRNGTAIYFSYNPESREVRVTPVDAVITETEAKKITRYDLPDAEIKKVTFGLEGGEPVWEVSYRDKENGLGYHYLHGDTGQWYETISQL